MSDDTINYILKYNYYDEHDVNCTYEIKEFESLQEIKDHLEYLVKRHYSVEVEGVFIKEDLNLQEINQYLTDFRIRQLTLYKVMDVNSKLKKLLEKKDRLIISLDKNRENLSDLGIQKKTEDISKLEEKIKMIEFELEEVRQELNNCKVSKLEL